MIATSIQNEKWPFAAKSVLMNMMPMVGHKVNWGNIMNITEFVADRLKDATESELKDIVANGIELDDCDMLEALENEFLSQAKEKLSNAKH